MNRYPDLDQARPFADCPDQDAVIKGPQQRAVRWLIKHEFPGVLAASTILADGQLYSSSACLRFFDAPYGARVGVTEAGPTLWVPGSFESASYVPAFTHFLAYYGWSGDFTDGEFDVDHVVPRAAYYHRHDARRLAAGGSPTRDDWFLMMAAPSGHNRSWGSWWEKAAVESGHIGFFSILKALDCPAPNAKDRDGTQFRDYAREHGPFVAAHLDLPSRLPLLDDSGDAYVVARMLDLSWPGEVDAEEWLTWALMWEAVKTHRPALLPSFA